MQRAKRKGKAGRVSRTDTVLGYFTGRNLLCVSLQQQPLADGGQAAWLSQ